MDGHSGALLLEGGSEQGAARKAGYGATADACAPTPIRLYPHERQQHFPWVQVTLVSAAAVGMVLVVFVFANDTSPWHDLFSRGTWHVIGNFSAAFGFFAVSDVIAQALPLVKSNRRMGRSVDDRLHVNFARAARCGALGIFINGLGYYAWLHALNKTIPQKEVERYSWHAFGFLVGKSLLDSCLWGTTSNSVGIVGRRMLEGDSLAHAVNIWADNILSVTAWELRFWPLWSACEFYLVATTFQVVFASFGALLWNIYLSYTALHDPLDPALGPTHRVRVDGVASPVRRFRLSVDNAPPELDLLNAGDALEDFCDAAEEGIRPKKSKALTEKVKTLPTRLPPPRDTAPPPRGGGGGGGAKFIQGLMP